MASGPSHWIQDVFILTVDLQGVRRCEGGSGIGDAVRLDILARQQFPSPAVTVLSWRSSPLNQVKHNQSPESGQCSSPRLQPHAVFARSLHLLLWVGSWLDGEQGTKYSRYARTTESVFREGQPGQRGSEWLYYQASYRMSDSKVSDIVRSFVSGGDTM
ncbi:unnamed protein product [Arctogadus glacialis]